MTKFFIPVPRGAPKGFAHPPKQKKSGSCVQTLQKKVMVVLKRLLTREIQKTIRKLHEQTEENEKQKVLARLQKYKKIGKAELKHLSYFIMLDELNVETGSLKKHFKIAPAQEQKQLPEQVQLFYDAIKAKNLYKNEIEDAQRIRNQVSEKKKIKKEKAKLKKKAKVAVRKEKGEQQPKELAKDVEANAEAEKIEEEEGIEASASVNDRSEQNVAKKVLKQRESKPSFKNKHEVKKNQKTQFKKTGRNKFLQEKRNQKQSFSKQREQQQQQPKPVPAKEIPGRHETPHPSWQAKREIKNQMFLQPFQGKRILL